MNNNRTVASLAAATLSLMAVLAAPWSRSAGSSFPPQGTGEITTLTGMVTDSKCKGRIDRKAVTLSMCARQCTHWEGADYVLLVGNAVYVLNGYRAGAANYIAEAQRETRIRKDLDRFAGGRATITGVVNGDLILVDSVTAVKKH